MIYESPPQHIIDRKRRARMERIDSMSPELRECVHDYGLTVVSAFLDHKVTEPRRIRHLVETVLDEFSPTRGSYSAQGIRKDVSTGLTVSPQRDRARNSTGIER